MNEVFIVCNHDRRTDDLYYAFTSEQSAKDKARELMAHWKDDGKETTSMYGDWCIYINDDYYCMVQRVTVEK